jgi:hypothetical protein
MAYRRANQLQITHQLTTFSARPTAVEMALLRFVCHDRAVNVHRGPNVRVPHELQLHCNRSPTVQP